MSTVAKPFFQQWLENFCKLFFFFNLDAPYLVFINFTSGEPSNNQIETGSAEEKLNNQWEADPNP